MSVKLVTDEITKFLSRSDPEVLCIHGKWGIGKTFTWEKQLELAQKAGAVKLPRYSYVSLFGIKSLDELKFAIFENVIILDEGLKKPTLATLDSYISKNIGSWRRWTKIAQSIPLVRNALGGDITPLISFMTIKDQIICFDDLERRGMALDIQDVLGLVSYLKEQRNCKIALILNDEQLEPESKQTFDKHLEKIVDISVLYRPSPEDAVNIAITDASDLSRHVANRCIALGLTNIRVIRRALHFANAVQPLLEKFNEQVLRTATASIVLFSWAHDAPEDAPSIDFLRRKTLSSTLKQDEKISEQEIAWNALLDAYNYRFTDEFDLLLMEGICNGYFDPQKVTTAAQPIHEKFIATQADESFDAAWRRYHDSFDNNQNEVLDGLYISFMKNSKYITPINLNGTVKLFKELGRPEQANEMIEHYMITRSEDDIKLFDLAGNPFGDRVDDPDVQAAFLEKTEGARKEIPDISKTLLEIGGSWNDGQLTVLEKAPIDEYRAAFKSHSGQELRQILANVFQFDRISNASDQMKEISRRAREALRLIGTESELNARRVQRYVNVKPPEK